MPNIAVAVIGVEYPRQRLLLNTLVVTATGVLFIIIVVTLLLFAVDASPAIDVMVVVKV